MRASSRRNIPQKGAVGAENEHATATSSHLVSLLSSLMFARLPVNWVPRSNHSRPMHGPHTMFSFLPTAFQRMILKPPSVMKPPKSQLFINSPFFALATPYTFAAISTIHVFNNIHESSCLVHGGVGAGPHEKKWIQNNSSGPHAIGYFFFLSKSMVPFRNEKVS